MLMGAIFVISDSNPNSAEAHQPMAPDPLPGVQYLNPALPLSQRDAAAISQEAATNVFTYWGGAFKKNRKAYRSAQSNLGPTKTSRTMLRPQTTTLVSEQQ